MKIIDHEENKTTTNVTANEMHLHTPKYRGQLKKYFDTGQQNKNLSTANLE